MTINLDFPPILNQSSLRQYPPQTMKRLQQNLNDSQRPLLGPNYWFLQTMGYILPKSNFGYLSRILIHELYTLNMITEYAQLLILVRSDFDLALTNMKVSMLSIVCVVKLNTILLRQDSWMRLLNYVTEADNDERKNKTEKTVEIINKYTRYCRKITFFYWIFVFLTGLLLIGSPFVKLFSSTNYRKAVLNGTEKIPQILNTWMPFDMDHSPGGWFALVWHGFVCSIGGLTIAAFDGTVIVMLVFIKGKFALLKEKSKQIFTCLDDEEEDAETKIRRLHEEHVLLIENLALFNSVLSPVMFVYVVMSSLMICASAFKFTSAAGPLQQFTQAEYLVFGLGQLLLICWHCSDAQHQNEVLFRGPYESEWPSAHSNVSSHSDRRNLLLLTGQFKIVHRFSAGPFTDLTLSTFVTILKGAYSYYTLLNKNRK